MEAPRKLEHNYDDDGDELPAVECAECTKLNQSHQIHSYSHLSVLNQSNQRKRADQLKYIFTHMAHLNVELVEMWIVWMREPKSPKITSELLECGAFEGAMNLCTHYRNREYLAGYALQFLSTVPHGQLDKIMPDWVKHPAFFDNVLFYIEHGVCFEQQYALLAMSRLFMATRHAESPEFQEKHLAPLLLALEKVLSAPEDKLVVEIDGLDHSWQVNALKSSTANAKKYSKRYVELNKETAYHILTLVSGGALYNRKALNTIYTTHPNILPALVKTVSSPPPTPYPTTDAVTAAAEVLFDLLALPPNFEYFQGNPYVDHIEAVLAVRPTLIGELIGAVAFLVAPDYPKELNRLIADEHKYLMSAADRSNPSDKEELVQRQLIGRPLVALLEALLGLTQIESTWPAFKAESETIEKLSKTFIDFFEKTVTRTDPRHHVLWFHHSHDQISLVFRRESHVYHSFTLAPVTFPVLVQRLAELKLTPKPPHFPWTDPFGMMAESAKQEGNKWYSQGKHAKAVLNYTQAIWMASTVPGDQSKYFSVYYGNRAAARIAEGQYHLAEKDAIVSLNLAPENEKFQLRLAGIREKLATGAYPRPDYFKPTTASQ